MLFINDNGQRLCVDRISIALQSNGGTLSVWLSLCSSEHKSTAFKMTRPCIYIETFLKEFTSLLKNGSINSYSLGNSSGKIHLYV